MNLSTHLIFAIAIGFVFFGHPEIALLIGFGALLPDLDREYWFIPPTTYRDEQYHRSLFHNMFIMALAYLFSPFLSLGMFLHVFQDSFTTIKDRGCEWLYPITRWVKRGRKDPNGNDEQIDPSERVYFYQEDPKGYLENADPDLREVGDRPIPWRRTYGPALNGQLLDQGFLIGSAMVILIWLFAPSTQNAKNFLTFFTQNWSPFMIACVSIALIFSSGELDRRTRVLPLRLPGLSALKSLLLASGVFLSFYCIFLYRNAIWANFEAITGYWISILLSVLIALILGILLIKWHTRNRRIATV